MYQTILATKLSSNLQNICVFHIYSRVSLFTKYLVGVDFEERTTPTTLWPCPTQRPFVNKSHSVNNSHSSGYICRYSKLNELLDKDQMWLRFIYLLYVWRFFSHVSLHIEHCSLDKIELKMSAIFCKYSNKITFRFIIEMFSEFGRCESFSHCFCRVQYNDTSR